MSNSENTKEKDAVASAVDAIVMCREYLRKIFFCFGVNVFDYSKIEYGGYNHFIARWFFARKLAYLSIALVSKVGFSWIHNDEEYYYDGYHNSIHIGFVMIAYGT